MSNPYQNPSSFQDDPSSTLPTGLPGFALRRPSQSSHVSMAPASSGFARSGATFAQLLNPPGNGDASDSSSGSGGSRLHRHFGYDSRYHNVGGSGGDGSGGGNGSRGRYPYTAAEAEALQTGAFDGPDGLSGGSLQRWFGSRNAQLPSFSRAFEPFYRESAYGFFIPSYLRDSVYVQKLEERHKRNVQALREDHQQQQQYRHQLFQHDHGATSSHSRSQSHSYTQSHSHIHGRASHFQHGHAETPIAGAGLPTSSGPGSYPGTSSMSLSGMGMGSMGMGMGMGSGDAGSLAGRGSSHSLYQVGPDNGGGGGGSNGGKLSSSASMSSLRGLGFDMAIDKRRASALEDESLTPLPTGWDRKEKTSSLDVLSGGLGVKYTAPKSTDRDHGSSRSIRADHFMPAQCGIFYFEVTVLGKYKGESSIGIGFSDAKASLARPPGWEPNSWGYHSDDGNIFVSNSSGKPYGPFFGPGDVIGCGINFRTGTAFFTKNGGDLGTAFYDIKPNLKLFPTVGLKRTGEYVHVNFGQVPFVFNIDDLMKKERSIIQQQISETSTKSLAPSLSESELVQQLVLQFLQHDGYIETARAFADEIQTQKKALTLNPSEEVKKIQIMDNEDAKKRQRIRRAILEGDIDQALKLTNINYPSVLEDNEEVYFHLRCRKFIEMIRREAELKLVGCSSSSHPDGPGKQSSISNSLRARRESAAQDMDMDDIDMVGAGSDEQPPETQSIVEEAIQYGQSLKSEYVNDTRPEIHRELQNIFSLIAYDNPLKKKSMAHLLEQKGRVDVAEELNSAILESRGESSRSALENVYAQTSVLLDELRQDGGPGSFVTIQDIVDQVPKPPVF